MVPNYMNKYGSYFMMLYMTIDYLLQPDMTLIYKVHHFIAGLLCWKDVSSPTDIRQMEDNKAIRSALFGTEYSTIILCMYQICPKMLKRYIIPMFLVTFLYFRIYRMAHLYSRHIQTFEMIRDGGILSLYGMNSFWLFEILKKMRVESWMVDGAMFGFFLYLANRYGWILFGICMIGWVNFVVYIYITGFYMMLLIMMKDGGLRDIGMSLLPNMILVSWHHYNRSFIHS